MSFLGFFPNSGERRRAREEAASAMQDYGDKAAGYLWMRAQRTQSSERRVVYKLAREIVLKESRLGASGIDG